MLCKLRPGAKVVVLFQDGIRELFTVFLHGSTCSLSCSLGSFSTLWNPLKASRTSSPKVYSR